MKVGISTYALTWSIGVPRYETPQSPLTAQGMLDLASSLNILVVQFADNLPLHELSNAELIRLKEQAQRQNILIEIGTRGTDPDNLINYLEVAEILGAPLVRTLIEDKPLEVARKELESVLPLFEKADIRIGLENHGGQTSNELAHLIRELDSATLGCCLDTVNSFGALEGSLPVIPVLLPLAINIHVKDFKISRLDHQMGFLITGTPAGKGMLDIQSMVATAQQYGHNPNLILESWVPYENSVEETIATERKWLEGSVRYLQSITTLVTGVD